MKIGVHGEMTIPEIRQAIYEQLTRIEDELAVRYSRGATIYINPTNGFGDDVTPVDHAGEEIRKLNSRGPISQRGRRIQAVKRSGEGGDQA